MAWSNIENAYSSSFSQLNWWSSKTLRSSNESQICRKDFSLLDGFLYSCLDSALKIRSILLVDPKKKIKIFKLESKCLTC